MARTERDFENPVLDDTEHASLGSAKKTERVEDMLILEPEPTESFEPPTQAAPEPVGDDVYVILPEGEAADIPIVETQIVDEVPDFGDTPGSGFRNMAAETEAMDTVQVMDSLPHDLPSGIGSDTHILETQNMNQIAADLDDEVLTGESHRSSSRIAAAARPARLERRSGRAGKVFLAAAALLACAAGGYYYYFVIGPGAQGGAGPFTVAVATGGATDPSAGHSAGSEGAETSVSGEGAAAAAVNAARAVVRGKVLLSLDLGFGGEVKNE